MDPNPLPESKPPLAGARRRVLLADDDDDVRSIFELVLSEHYEVASAKNGDEALSLARALRPHVFLVDWTFPDTSGAELVQRLRASAPELADVPVVIVSGMPHVGAFAERIGAISCSKPCDVDQLLGAIERALRTNCPH
jgi:DNA-binding NtrC family response regulator